MPLGQFCRFVERHFPVVRVDELHVRTRQQIRFGVAENLLPRGVDPLEVAVEAGDAQQVERQGEETVQFLLRPTPIDEQSDLVADAREHRQEIFIRRANLAAEELQDALHLAAEQDREAERAVQSFARGNRRARKIRVEDDVVDPDGLRLRPHTSRQTDATAEGRRPTDRVEFRKLNGGSAPGVDAAKEVGLAVDPPERAVLPVERFANRFEYPGRRFAECGRFDERARRDVLGRQTTLGMRIRAGRSRLQRHWRVEGDYRSAGRSWRSFRSKRDARIDPRGTPGRHESGQAGDNEQQADNAGVGDRVEPRHGKQERQEDMAGRHRAQEAQQNAEDREDHPLPEDEGQNAAAGARPVPSARRFP